MLYQGKEIEILSRKSVFGKQLADIKILSTGAVKSVPVSDLSDEKKVPTAMHESAVERNNNIAGNLV